jgi:hypothetical protein
MAALNLINPIGSRDWSNLGELAVAEEDDVELIAIDLMLKIQAEIFIDLAAGSARINHFVAAETIRNIEAKIVHELRERAAGLQVRGLTTEYRASGWLPWRYDQGQA